MKSMRSGRRFFALLSFPGLSRLVAMKMTGTDTALLFLDDDSVRLEVGLMVRTRFWPSQPRFVARGGFRRHGYSCRVSRKARVTGVQSRRVKATTGRTRRGLAGRVSSLARSGTM